MRPPFVVSPGHAEMLLPPLRRLRTSRTLTALVGGVAVAVAVGAAAFAIQAVALPRPSEGQLLAAQYLRWLIRHRLVEATETIDGRRLRSDCLSGWFAAPGKSRPRRGAELIRSDGARLLEIRGRVFVLAPPDGPSGISSAAFLVAGCPRALAQEVGDALQLRRPVALAATTADGEPAYRLRLRSRSGVVDLFASRSSDRPLEIAVRGRGLTGRADVETVRLTPTTFERLTHVVLLPARSRGSRL